MLRDHITITNSLQSVQKFQNVLVGIGDMVKVKKMIIIIIIIIIILSGKDIFYPAAGGSDDWAHSIGVDLSFTFELRDKGNYGFMLPEFLIPAAVEEAARGISAIYDHLVPKSDGATNTGAEPAKEKPQRKTKCTLNPEEAYIGDRVLDPEVTPTFQCTMKNGKCKTSCPAGTQPKLKKAACKKNGNTMIWKPDARRWHNAEICAQGQVKSKLKEKLCEKLLILIS